MHCEGHEGFFIVEKANRKKLLKPENKDNVEKYRELGWEISDDRMIAEIIETEELGSKIGHKDHYTDTNHTKMFVFGAGASAHCVFDTEHHKDRTDRFKEYAFKPPTGFEIFDERYSAFTGRYPACDATITLYEEANRDIEKAMQDEFEKAYKDFKPSITKRHMNIQFYLSDLFQEISQNVVKDYSRTNLFNLFSTKLQVYLEGAAKSKKGVSIVSFNYDTILDTYLTKCLGMPLDEMDDYIMERTSRIKLFKPHGSCNWGWPIRPIEGLRPDTDLAQALYENDLVPSEVYYRLCGDFSETLVSNSWGLEHRHLNNKKGRFVLNRNLVEPMYQGRHYFPALLMPYRDKDEFVMPYDHFWSIMDSLHDVEDLYIIGWKGNERLFNRYQVSEMRKLKRVIIADPDFEGVKKNLKPLLDKYKPKVVEVEGGFEEFVRKRMDELV